MALFLLSIVLLVLGGLAACGSARSSAWGSILGAGSAVCGSAVGLVAAVSAFVGAPPHAFRVFWAMPGGAFALSLSPLSAFFLIPIFCLSMLAAVYGVEYLTPFRGEKDLGVHWLFYNLLVAGMALAVVARNALLFLAVWEVMSLASFFLVVFEHEKRSVRDAGWTYLVATHVGTAFLIAMFLLLGRMAGSLDFDRWVELKAAMPPAMANGLFLLAVVGFGTKAGFMPLHVWLPEAHPAAPSHVSALMSGVMIKTGIYGLLLTLTFLGPPPAWWGWLLIGIGLTSGCLGVLFALAQHDIKRLLAYHSVENIGIIALGMGVGLLGLSSGSAVLAALGFAGALLHVVNHAAFKGLLFLGAGAIWHGTHTREIDQLGGLLKRMPWTGLTFVVGAVAISGLPPLNGFISEFMIYLGSFQGGIHAPLAVAIPSLAVIAGLALIGGLAAACFTKAFGVIFLGEPRGHFSTQTREVGMGMRLPMVILAAGCLAIGLLAPAVVHAMAPVVQSATGLPPATIAAGLGAAIHPLSMIVAAAVVLLALVAALTFARRLALARRPVTRTGTWDCGYARPSARMQYTASSFAQPLTDLFRPFLRTRRKTLSLKEVFPGEASLATHTPDVFREGVFGPIFAATVRALGRLKAIQQGRVHIYVLYVVIAILVLLVWKL